MTLSLAYERCVHTRSVASSCRACVDSCPAGAISLEGAKPAVAVNLDACTDCGLCQAVCPTEAFRGVFDVTSLPAQVTRLACGEAGVPCVGAVSTEDLVALAQQSGRLEVVGRTCAAGTKGHAQAARQVEQAVAFLRALGLKAELSWRDEAPATTTARSTGAAAAAGAPHEAAPADAQPLAAATEHAAGAATADEGALPRAGADFAGTATTAATAHGHALSLAQAAAAPAATTPHGHALSLAQAAAAPTAATAHGHALSLAQAAAAPAATTPHGRARSSAQAATAPDATTPHGHGRSPAQAAPAPAAAAPGAHGGAPSPEHAASTATAHSGPPTPAHGSAPSHTAAATHAPRPALSAPEAPRPVNPRRQFLGLFVPRAIPPAPTTRGRLTFPATLDVKRLREVTPTRRRARLLAALPASAAPKVATLAADLIDFTSSKQVDATTCTGCSACVTACPTGALTTSRLKDQLRFDGSRCVKCGLCHDVCEPKAITLSPALRLVDVLDFAPKVLVTLRMTQCGECGASFKDDGRVQVLCNPCREQDAEARELSGVR